MTTQEVIQQVQDAGGRLRIIAGGRLYVERVPKHLVSEVRRLKAMIIRDLEQKNFEYLKSRFNLKGITPERMQGIAGGRPWRVMTAQLSGKWDWQGPRYRWKKVQEHEDECNSLVNAPGGQVCSKCYPYAPAQCDNDPERAQTVISVTTTTRLGQGSHRKVSRPATTRCFELIP